MYRRIRTATDRNGRYGRSTCWSSATSHITPSRASGGGNVPLRGVAPSRWSGLIEIHKPRKRRPPYYLTPVGHPCPTTGSGGDKADWQLALCKVLREAKRLHGQIRTATDRNGRYGRSTCRSSATSHIPPSRASGGGNVPLRGVAPSRWSGLIEIHKPRKRRYTQTTSRLSGFSRTTGAKASRQGALSRRYPRVLSRRRRGRGLTSSTEPPSADKARGSKRERAVYY